jgi:chemotaxis protein histidine kinase CheA
VSGSTILGNGRVALILDVPAIVTGLSKAAPEETAVTA